MEFRFIDDAVDLDHELLSLTNRRHTIEAKSAECALYCTALGVEDFRLQTDIDNDAGHGRSKW